MDANSYLNEKKTALSPGTYTIMLYPDGGSGSIDKITFEVKYPTINKACYSEGSVDVSINGYVNESAWVGLYYNSTTDFQSIKSLAWHYANIEVTNRLDYGGFHITHVRFNVSKVSISNVSSYKITLFTDENYNNLADQKQLQETYRHDDILTKYSGTTYTNKLHISSKSYEIGDVMKIDFSKISNKNAWVGLYPANTTDYKNHPTGMWVYTSTGTQWQMNAGYSDFFPANGTVYLHANKSDIDTGTELNTPTGEYKLVLFGNEGYTNILDTVTITIKY